MGCDIHSFAEVRKNGKWEVVDDDVFPYTFSSCGSEPFHWRSYGIFGFLANVRNYSRVPTIEGPKHAIPVDASPTVVDKYEQWSGDAHTASWLTLRQLLEFDYDKVFWDRRITKQLGPNCWTGVGLAENEVTEGGHPTVRTFLGEHFFGHLEVLKTLGALDDVRIVFWFDN